MTNVLMVLTPILLFVLIVFSDDISVLLRALAARIRGRGK